MTSDNRVQFGPNFQPDGKICLAMLAPKVKGGESDWKAKITTLEILYAL